MERKIDRICIKYEINFFSILIILICMLFISPIKASAETTDNKNSATDSYVLTLIERGGVKEEIKGVDINLKSNSLKDGISFDERLLQERINKLVCLDNTKIIQSQNARLMYENNSYVIAREVYGNKIKSDILFQSIVAAIKNGDTVLNLEVAKCYDDPKVLQNSPEIINAKDLANKYITSNITYYIAGLTQVLDGSQIKDWISFDANYRVILNEGLIRSYVDNLSYIYSSSLGKNIKVSGGYDGNNHSWVIDKAQETQALINNIKNGQTLTKSPIYTQTAAAGYFSNVGGSFVEIDLTKQHLWYYKDGYLVTEGDVVTGNESNGNSTPEGLYHLYYKQKDTVLVGEDYASPVSFWMPFNNNIGIHDANWRSEFGGQIYKTSGSHGCINSPYYLAKDIYDNLNKGENIICHY